MLFIEMPSTKGPPIWALQRPHVNKLDMLTKPVPFKNRFNLEYLLNIMDLAHGMAVRHVNK